MPKFAALQATFAIAFIFQAGCTLPSAEAPHVVFDDMHAAGTVLAFTADESLLASSGRGGWVRLYQLPAIEPIAAWRAHGNNTVTGLSLEEGQVLTAGYDARLAVWTRQGALLREKHTASPITHMVSDANRERVITGHRDGSVRIWRRHDFASIRVYPLHEGPLRRVALHPDSGRLATSGADGRVFLIDGEQVQPLPRPPTDAQSLTFAANGTRLFGGGWFKLFRWDVPDGNLSVLDTPHRGIIKDLHWIEPTGQLASISRQTDSNVLFLDPETGAALRRFQKHALCGGAVEVSSQASFMATTSDDASVRIWDLRP